MKNQKRKRTQCGNLRQCNQTNSTHWKTIVITLFIFLRKLIILEPSNRFWNLFNTHLKNTVFTNNKFYWFDSAWRICLQSRSVHLWRRRKNHDIGESLCNYLMWTKNDFLSGHQHTRDYYINPRLIMKPRYILTEEIRQPSGNKVN